MRKNAKGKNTKKCRIMKYRRKKDRIKNQKIQKKIRKHKQEQKKIRKHKQVQKKIRKKNEIEKPKREKPLTAVENGATFREYKVNPSVHHKYLCSHNGITVNSRRRMYVDEYSL